MQVHALGGPARAKAKRRAIRRLFLESGVTNTHAHEFFEEIGFHQVSMVMMKSLPQLGELKIQVRAHNIGG